MPVAGRESRGTMVAPFMMKAETPARRTSRAKELADGAIRFTDRGGMIHGAGKIGVRERDSAVGLIAQHLARRGLAIDAEEKARLRIHVGVPPAIQNDPGDVSAWIEAPRSEHVPELFPERTLVLRE